MASDDFRTLAELFLHAVERQAKPDAFLSKSGGRYVGVSSRQALEKAAALALALDRFGIRKGDRVALMAENRVEWALTDYALLGLGAVGVPIYPTLLEPDIEFILRDSGSRGVVLSTGTQLRKILNIRSRLPDLNFVLAMDCGGLEGTGADCWQPAIDAATASGVDAVSFFREKAGAVAANDVASILYTSGTTGKSKGVILTHSNIASNIQSCRPLFPLAFEDVAMSFLPLSHILERMLDYFYFWVGVSIGYAESFDALPLNLLEVRPTVMGVVPRVLEKIHEKAMEAVRQAPSPMRKLFYWAFEVGRRYFPHELEGRIPPLTLRLKRALADLLIYSKVRARLGGRVKFLISGSAPLSRELAEFFHAMGLPVYEGYGLTETSPVIAVNHPGHVKLGTVGPVIPRVEVKLGEPVGDAEGGEGREILVRGPNVTPGYYHLEEENREAFADGWFRTGDLGTLDADRYLSITGRKRNLFKTSGGKYVSPEKLENLFQGHPYVSQIVVLGDGRRFVSALIVPNFASLENDARHRGIAFSNRRELVAQSEIRSFFEQQIEELTRWLPPHEKIRQFALLPKEFTIASGELSSTQKIKRRVVEERYRDLVEEMYQRPPRQPEEAPAAAR